MKRILAFRCAAEDVMEKLFTRIGDREDITCYVQENAVREYGSKYPHVKFLSIHENYFNYDSFLKSADIVQEKFDRIYIPSTSRNFNGFDAGKAVLVIEPAVSKRFPCESFRNLGSKFVMQIDSH